MSMKKWKELDAERARLEGGIDPDTYMNPSNMEEEYEKTMKAFKSGGRYEPVFSYQPLPEIDWKALEKFINSLDRTDPVEAMFARWGEYRFLELEMAERHDAKVVDTNSRKIFGFPSKELLAISQKNLEDIPAESSDSDTSGKILDAETCAVRLRESMKEYGFDWQIRVVKDMGIKACVDNIAKEFCIRADTKWRESDVRMIAVHEIGTHVLRAVNGYNQPLTIFGTGLPGYQETEEGLAEYTEVSEDCFSPVVHRRISARAIATELASHSSFYDVFTAMTEYYKADAAFDIALRAKLGIADCSEPGSYVKDYLYLHGLHKVTDFFKNSNEEDQRLLYAGKIRIEDVPLVKILIDEGHLVYPVHFPGFMERRS